ncbi:cupin domain-containing protein [Lentzea sp. HUAS12]|uniref:cupin domain-containing protein n=1 Tax=Lentzea sp. HUAS12 TaxID=2951806 RepID=UPI0020A16F22|nr:cupin domain-containing protein [Lentzea sp. HUAS12]USX56119.1 cupin domain-containing protein [Lentzea sp. HUAS12]
MSYPEEVYFGQTGEVNARFRPASTPPDKGTEGDGIHYLATTATTGGEFGLYRVMMRPRAGGPATHFHRTISESFFVLNGVVRLYNGDRWIEAGPGDFLHVPQGGLHAFRNDSDAAAEMLLLFTPGAPREEYFERLGDIAEEDLTAFRVKHDSYFV